MNAEKATAWAFAAIVVLLALMLLVLFGAGMVVVIDQTCESVKGRACG